VQGKGYAYDGEGCPGKAVVYALPGDAEAAA
jgi:hypothetical protein